MYIVCTLHSCPAANLRCDATLPHAFSGSADLKGVREKVQMPLRGRFSCNTPGARGRRRRSRPRGRHRRHGARPHRHRPGARGGRGRSISHAQRVGGARGSRSRAAVVVEEQAVGLSTFSRYGDGKVASVGM
jgi:hypothetical protein